AADPRLEGLAEFVLQLQAEAVPVAFAGNVLEILVPEVYREAAEPMRHIRPEGESKRSDRHSSAQSGGAEGSDGEVRGLGRILVIEIVCATQRHIRVQCKCLAYQRGELELIDVGGAGSKECVKLSTAFRQRDASTVSAHRVCAHRSVCALERGQLLGGGEVDHREGAAGGRFEVRVAGRLVASAQEQAHAAAGGPQQSVRIDAAAALIA